jgi:NADH-quinone oxidoreductase subunit A
MIDSSISVTCSFYKRKIVILNYMLEQYIGVAIMLLMSIGIAVGMVAMTTVLGPKRKFADKMEPFECGESQLVSPHQRFSVKFYLVAVLFVLFDIEAIFFFPWAILFRRLGMFGFIEMLLFIIILGVGLIYVWKRGGLDWE